MLVSDILFRTARDRAGRLAVWFEGNWHTYGEISQAAGLLADFLRRANVLPGERVAILLDNSFDYIVAHFGALAAGAVEVSLKHGSEVRGSEISAAGLRGGSADRQSKT